MPRVVCISDTHEQNINTKWNIPDGDILIHAGDATARGKHESIARVGRQIGRLPHRYKLFVPGNHDKMFGHSRGQAIALFAQTGIITLIDETIDIMGVRIHGCPWIQLQQEDYAILNPEALNFSDLDVRNHYMMIPEKPDILVTHQPPYGMLDEVSEKRLSDGRLLQPSHAIGSPVLASQIIYRIHPRFHVFGHNHGLGGRVRQADDIIYVNAALVDDSYKPAWEPVVIEM